jgi:hypothetical protein
LADVFQIQVLNHNLHDAHHRMDDIDCMLAGDVRNRSLREGRQHINTLGSVQIADTLNHSDGSQPSFGWIPLQLQNVRYPSQSKIALNTSAGIIFGRPGTKPLDGPALPFFG